MNSHRNHVSDIMSGVSANHNASHDSRLQFSNVFSKKYTVFFVYMWNSALWW